MDSLTLKNQEIIAQALIDLDYQENKLAKVLANGKSEFVGILLPNLFLHYYAEMLNQLLATYETFGYKFLVFAGTGAEETERKYLQELLAYKIEGLIVLSLSGLPYAERFRKRVYPVFADCRAADFRCIVRFLEPYVRQILPFGGCKIRVCGL